MLPMFRRIFESILVRRLSPDHDWSQLHPGQAGFRRGWSCASAQMYNHESAHTRRNIAVFLDFANAFPSVTASLVAFVLETRGAPQSTQRLVWSLLTRAAAAVLVVNGRRCRELAFQRGLTQGAICSPALFNLIIDELVRLL
ncbi:unnamed protein product, partial [Tilletia laevis]